MKILAFSSAKIFLLIIIQRFFVTVNYILLLFLEKSILTNVPFNLKTYIIFVVLKKSRFFRS